MPASEALATALNAAHAARAVIEGHYRGELGLRYKADRSPVTAADVEAEDAIRRVIHDAFPEHGFYGEESGRWEGGGRFLWLVDPIDGTKSFVREIPFFSTQIALLAGGGLTLGVSSAPACSELAWAERGQGARLDGRPIRVSDVDTLERASLSLGNLKTIAGDRRWAALGSLVRRVDRVRGYGDFYHYHLLASGRIDAVLESDVNILDVAALSVIVEEAGGRVTELDGAPLGLQSTTILASNGHLHEALLEGLNGTG